MSTQTATPSLDKAIAAARRLPAPAQEAIAREIMESIEDLSPSVRPPERQAIIEDRLRRSLVSISRDELMAMLRRYNPAL